MNVSTTCQCVFSTSRTFRIALVQIVLSSKLAEEVPSVLSDDLKFTLTFLKQLWCERKMQQKTNPSSCPARKTNGASGSLRPYKQRPSYINLTPYIQQRATFIIQHFIRSLHNELHRLSSINGVICLSTGAAGCLPLTRFTLK